MGRFVTDEGCDNDADVTVKAGPGPSEGDELRGAGEETKVLLVSSSIHCSSTMFYATVASATSFLIFFPPNTKYLCQWNGWWP